MWRYADRRSFFVRVAAKRRGANRYTLAKLGCPQNGKCASGDDPRVPVCIASKDFPPIPTSSIPLSLPSSHDLIDKLCDGFIVILEQPLFRRHSFDSSTVSMRERNVMLKNTLTIDR